MLRKELNAIKREEYPWMLEVTKCAPQLALKNDLNSAFRNFFKGSASFPQFKKKGVHDSFTLSNDQFKVNGKKVQVPHIGKVRLAEKLRFDGRIIDATISRRADNWYIAIRVEMIIDLPLTDENQAVGVDLGVSTLAALSDGTKVTGTKASRKYEAKLRRLNQELSRRVGAKKGETKSKNFKKTKRKIARLYAKMATIRADDSHKLTTMLTQKYTLIGIEDLNVKGMLSNHKLARSVADMSFFEFRRQLTYKAQTTQSRVVVADRWFASSKTCSECGSVKDKLELSERTYHCEFCGFVCDRDVNAALNLRNYAVRHSQ
jgi:putative transposase